MKIYDPLFRFEEVENVLSGTFLLQRMLEFEAALAESEADCGIIPRTAASAIVRCCTLDSLNIPDVSASAEKAGNLAIPLLRQLTEAVRRVDSEAARYIHWGATSQDVIDTALVLQIRSALRLMATDLDQTCDGLARLTAGHRDTFIAGRTWLQHAAPTTFGVKTATMLNALLWHRGQLRNAFQEVAVVQLGGSVGTLPSLKEDGMRVATAVADKLGLAVPRTPWHTSRERFARLSTELGILAGTIGKLARDISLLSQSEVAEVAEQWEEGRGGSSTMPQKRNPVETAAILSLVVRVPGLVSTALASMVQEHERGLGGWQAEWEVLPELIGTTAGIVHHASSLVGRLKIDARKMKENLALTNGAIYAEAASYALAEKVGKAQAHCIVSRASARSLQQKSPLKSALMEDPEVMANLTSDEIDSVFDPSSHLGSTQKMIDGALTAYEQERFHAIC